MKALKYAAVATVLSFSLSACRNSADTKTLGGTRDTSNVSAGSNAGNGSNPSSLTDTAKTPAKGTGGNGNANPTGHMGTDSVKTKKKP